jgi:predicted MFS family arabinose efflux permease
MMGLSETPAGMSVSAGLLIGLGLSGTTFSVILGAVGRAVAPEKRSLANGIVFLFHQLCSFMGVWLGGYLYDVTGNYDVVWKIAILLSVAAAALHWFIKEAPIRRLESAEARA